jgi:hypothetical protein
VPKTAHDGLRGQHRYIGKTTRKLLAFRPFNSAPFIPGNSTLANAEQRVPFLPGIYGASGLYLDNPFTSSYHSYQIELNKRFSYGLQFNTSHAFKIH